MMSEVPIKSEPINLVRNLPLQNNRRVNSRAYMQPNASRPRGLSSPQSLNRSLLSPTALSLSSSSQTTDNLTLALSPRVNNLRPNLSPQRPNLSPLNNIINQQPNGHVQIPTPVNMVDRLTQPPNSTHNLSPMERFLALARKLSPRSLQNERRLSSIQSRLENNQGRPVSFHVNNRRLSPSYEDNRPQPLFPSGMKDANLIMNKLLASNPPISAPSPAMRKIRNLTPKLLLKSNNKSNSSKQYPYKKSPIGSSPLSKPPIIFKNETSIHCLPIELLNAIFSHLYSPRDLVSCSQVCKKWKPPSLVCLDLLIKNKPYAEIPMLRTLRKGLNETKLNLSSPANLHQVVDKLSVEYCQSNPLIYKKFAPKNPETMVNNLFWIFLFLDREFRSPSRRRVSCEYFIKLVHRGILEDIDKNTLKALYQDIKATRLVNETNDNNDNETIYINESTGVQQFLPHPVRRWWRRITHRGLGIDASDLDALSDVEEEDPFRSLE